MKRYSAGKVWEGQADCASCTLRNSVLFAGLEEKDFEQIHQPINIYSLLPGSVLYRAGDQGDRMFTIRSGILKLVQYIPDGTQRIVRILRANDMAGLEALLGEPYQQDAVVLQATESCSLPINLIQTLSQNNAAIYQELLNRWEQALKEADTWLTELSTGSARQRVARLLLHLARSNTNTFLTLFPCEGMGSMLGITTETVSRNMAEFKRKKLLIETGSNQFSLDTVELKKLVSHVGSSVTHSQSTRQVGKARGRRTGRRQFQRV